jgi:hypothetical protein
VNAATYFLRQLFDPDELETAGQRAQMLCFELVVLLRAQYELWTWAAIIPNQPEILAPTGLGTFIDVSFMLKEPQYAQINAIVCGALMLLGLTRTLRAGYALAFLSLSLQCAARYGMGKVQHGATMLGMAVLALAIAHLAYRREDLRRKATLGLLVAMISVGYLFAATNKLRSTGLRWVRGQNLWLWIQQKRLDGLSGGGRDELNFMQTFTLSDVRIATAQLTFGLLSELAAAIMWWRPARRWVMLSLAAMHLGISKVMNIHFMPSVLILLVLALPIAEVVDWVLRRRAERPPAAPTPRSTPGPENALAPSASLGEQPVGNQNAE